MSSNLIQSKLSAGKTINKPGLQLPGDYAIKALSIVTSDGTVVDITQLAVEISIFEDIFAPCVTGTILMGDALDLISNFKLQGNEWIILEIDKPGLGSPYKKFFRIYKIAERSIGTTIQNYLIHFTSEEMVLSLQYLISKSYKGMPITNMVKDILKNKLAVLDTKINVLDKSDGVYSLIIPRMNPFEAIEWLTSRAYDSDGSLFLFYENKDGYNFRSYKNIINQPIYQTYYQRPKTNSFEPGLNVNSVNYLKINQDFDLLQSGRYGAYASGLVVYDLVDHKLTPYSYSFKDFQILNSNLPINDTKNRLNDTVFNTYDLMFKFYPTVDSDPNINPYQPHKWLNPKAMKLAQLHTFRMTVTIPFDVLMKVGNIVEVEIPEAVPKDKKKRVNQARTGKYLVSAVHHTMIHDSATTVMELLSDSIEGGLYAPNNQSQGMISVKRG